METVLAPPWKVFIGLFHQSLPSVTQLVVVVSFLMFRGLLVALFLQVSLVCCHESFSQNPYILLAPFQMLCRVTLPLGITALVYLALIPLSRIFL